MSTYEERRDKRFYVATIAALKDIHDRGMQLPVDQRYSAGYGILRGYVENLLVNFAQAFSVEQLAEIRIVLDQLTRLVGEDEHLDKAAKARLDSLAQALRESEEESEEIVRQLQHEANERSITRSHFDSDAAWEDWNVDHPQL